MIRITPVRVIGADGEQVGIIETSDALRRAEEAGLDLVEIVPDQRPPICKIMDFGKFKYEQSKKDAKNKSASKASEMKEVRLGRSVKIDPHDVEIRVNQARKFLLDGHKVLITQRFKGREMAHKELGINRLRDIMKNLSEISRCETEPRWMGPQASIIMAPDKAKCDLYKRTHKIKDHVPAPEKKSKGPKDGKDSKDAKDGKGPKDAKHDGGPNPGKLAQPGPAHDHDDDDDDDDEHYQNHDAALAALAGHLNLPPAAAPGDASATLAHASPHAPSPTGGAAPSGPKPVVQQNAAHPNNSPASR